jgi:DNA invertase Pin-like site-specific DNA recombinase
MPAATNGNGLALDGPGAAYLRVSTDKQDTERQINNVRAFEERHGVRIPPAHWFEDHGWERDADARRPDFNRLLALARRGAVRWIVVDALDRFGTGSAKRLFGYLADLEEAGCRLYDASDKEWTGEDAATEITAWLKGRTSAAEQRDKSHRTLGGLVTYARDGEWMGGPPKLGFDVGCFDRASGKELWRVVFEGREEAGTETRRGKARPVYRVLRRKVYPGGRSERFDGPASFRGGLDRKHSPEVLRIVPSRDKAKLAAVRGLFRRYASEAVSFRQLAVWPNGLGLRNAFGKGYQSRDIPDILSDEAYLGYPTFGKNAGRPLPPLRRR